MSTAPQIKAQEVPKAEVAKLDKVDISERKQQLADQTVAMKQQAVLNVDRATEQGVSELKENEAAQQPKFQTQRNQIDIDEAKALDNQVLYAEARGDRGGIGKSQYASIENTAAQNRLAVNAAQIQLSSDTAKQIAKLRTEGEYEKADKLLAISQDYLGRLQELETWAEEQNIGIAEFNSKVDQYLSDYALETAKYKTDVDYKNAQLQQNDDDRKAQIGKTLMAAGVTPTGGMLSAMGLTPSDYLNYRLANLG